MPEPRSVQTLPAVSSTQSAGAECPPQREYYVDRLRVVMTALVILHHTAITYGAAGGWFYNELKPSSAPSSLLLTLFCATNQAYFMGLFFLLAGYFTPASLERKGYARFIGDRILRLGVPLLAFGLILGPLTAAVVNRFADGGGFWSTFVWLWNHKQFINGPLWFAQALLMFSLGYCIWRMAAGVRRGLADQIATPLPPYWKWLASALAVAAGAVAIRQFVPVGQNVFGLQLGYFASYIFLFAVGIAAWLNDWLRQLNRTHVQPWLITLVITWPMLPLTMVIAEKANGPGKSNFAGGFSGPALVYALWEPLVAWGIIAGLLLLFKRRFNQPSKLWAWLGRRAYAVYIIHPPVLVSIALLLHGWFAPALVKFTCTGALAIVACWLLADPLVRLPGVRRVV